MSDLEQYGYAVVASVLSPDEIQCFTALFSAAAPEAHGIRNLLMHYPEIRALATAPKIRALIEPVLGKSVFPVRGIYFDKLAKANWKVPWHQDVSIPVRVRRDVPGFGPWSTKGGVLHCDAPGYVLKKMLTVRVHLDACSAENGPLQVISGSHQHGRLNATQVEEFRRAAPAICMVPVGGALVMRPLLLHASAKAAVATHRRVIHLEYASSELPGGLQWACA